MDHTRGRSPSGGNRQHISPVPSPQNRTVAGPGLDPSITTDTFTTGPFNTGQQFNNPFLGVYPQQTAQQAQQDPNFYTHHQFNQAAFQENQYSGQTFDSSFPSNNYMYQQDSSDPADFAQHFSMDQSYQMNNQHNINPADLSKMSPQDQSSPNNLLPPEAHTSPGQSPASPVSTNGQQFYTPRHSRHTSLDPSSAYSQGEWPGMAFQQHRRIPSNHSDISSASNSPYLRQSDIVHDSIESNHSPFLSAQQDPGLSMGIEGFTLADQPQVTQSGPTYVSPRLMPTQEGLGIGQDMLLSQGMGGPGPEIYHGDQTQPFGQLQSMHARHQSGLADQFAPPTINIEPAPVSRQASFGPQGEPGEDPNVLSPPSSSRGRNRSKSDVTGAVRPLSRSGSPSVRSSPNNAQSNALRPHSPSLSISRESSPGVVSGRIDKRRASTSSIASRDYLLGLADPERPNASPGGSNSRQQKHPANFSCHLCDKKFTRAYNLRSHLRTHTDERPFVCTVCGKAFARQHDRKRHEGLHSGEKKFVCKGELHSSPGQYWGCGRRFARADALGRHFRSEAGRVCIKPLLDEEAAERRNKQFMEDQQVQASHLAQGHLQPIPQPLMIGMDPTTGTGGFALPAALLAQYPALQNIDWSQVPQANDDPGDLSDVGMGRNSFDGSSGYDYSDEGEYNETYPTGNGMQQYSTGQTMWQQ